MSHLNLTHSLIKSCSFEINGEIIGRYDLCEKCNTMSESVELFGICINCISKKMREEREAYEKEIFILLSFWINKNLIEEYIFPELRFVPVPNKPDQN